MVEHGGRWPRGLRQRVLLAAIAVTAVQALVNVLPQGQAQFAGENGLPVYSIAVFFCHFYSNSSASGQ